MTDLRFSRSKHEWSVFDDRRTVGPSGELVLAREDLPRLRCSELRRALGLFARLEDADTAVAVVSALPIGHLEEDGPFGPISFIWDESELLLMATCPVAWPEDGDEVDACIDVAALLRPMLDHWNATLRSVDVDDWHCTPVELALDIVVQPRWRGRTVEELFEEGQALLRLVDAFQSRSVSRDTLGDLVRGGGAALLIGMPEGNWLDAKSREYDLDTLHGQLSLAHAIGRFCNAEEGGLIIIGAEAKKVPGGEVIRAARGVAASAGSEARYRRVIDQRLYPPPFGLRVDVVAAAPGRQIILLDVPPQAEELKPFLVHGAIREDGNVEGAYISIVRRRGEASIPITAPMIHASLVAGRGVLRGTRPESSNEA